MIVNILYINVLKNVISYFVLINFTKMVLRHKMKQRQKNNKSMKIKYLNN